MINISIIIIVKIGTIEIYLSIHSKRKNPLSVIKGIPRIKPIKHIIK
jgi:hypothetical protein